jgi:hypothetical protein
MTILPCNLRRRQSTDVASGEAGDERSSLRVGIRRLAKNRAATRLIPM